MIRIVFLLRRKPTLSLAEFHKYWREEHGPLVASHAHHLRALKYVQVRRIEHPLTEPMAAQRGGMEPPYDGTAELWWESEDALRGALATESGQTAAAALLEDERRFIDLPNSPLWFAHEYPQVNPTPENIVARERSGIVKLYYPLRSRTELGDEAAQIYWRTSHGPLIRSQASGSGILRYVQVHRFASALENETRAARGTVVPSYMGHAELWLDQSIQRVGAEVAAAGKRAVEDESKFIDFKRSNIWFGKEHVFIDRM